VKPRKIGDFDFGIYQPGTRWRPADGHPRASSAYKIIRNDPQAKILQVESMGETGRKSRRYMSYSTAFLYRFESAMPAAVVPAQPRSQLNVDVPEDIKRALTARAGRTGKSKSSIVVEALDWYLAYHAAREPKAAE